MMPLRIQIERPRTWFRGLFIILSVSAVLTSSPAHGREADPQADSTSNRTGPAAPATLLTRPLIAAISLYQAVISPQQGEVCAFQPTCSHFAQQALRTHGLLQGGLMTSDRLQRCHTCAGGAYRRMATEAAHDPVDDHVLWGPARRDRPLPHRSPMLAALLSSALPGSGKVYAGRPADGLYSLLVTGSSVLVAASYGQDEKWTRAGLFGATGLFFYLGNIYGSAVEASRYSRTEREGLPEDGESDAAIAEYRRVLSRFPDDSTGFEARYHIGLAYLNLEQWSLARRELDLAARAASSDRQNHRARLRLGQSYLSEGSPDQGETVLRDLLRNSHDHGAEPVTAAAHYWLGVSTLRQGQWVEASGWFRNVSRRFPEAKTAAGARQLETAARRGYGLPRRSPALATTLSMVLPGSGQIYAGRFWNGLLSMALNAAAGYLTIDAFREDRRLDGTLLVTLVWSRFYFGGLQNAGRYAREFNRERAAEHLEVYETLMRPAYAD